MRRGAGVDSGLSQAGAYVADTPPSASGTYPHSCAVSEFGVSKKQ